MCYYNSYHNPQSLQFKDHKIKPVEYNAPVASGFDNPEWPVIVKNESGYENVLMEWGFLPNYITTTQGAYDFRHGYKDDKGKYHPAITTLNVVATDWLKRPLRKKDLVYIHDVAAGHSVYYNGILLGRIKEVEDGLLFEPHNPNYGFHSISKGGY